MRLPTHISEYINRSSQVLRSEATKMLRMSGTDAISRKPLTLLDFKTREDVAQLAKGSDSDVGGRSTAALALEADPADAGVLANGGRPYARFWGDMRTAVSPEMQGRLRGGYAGFRNKYRPSLFGEMTWDVENHEYLALRVRAGGHPRTRHAYYLNIQTDGPITTDLWQHRIYFRRDDGGWEDLFIPFDAFLLTNAGTFVSASVSMFRRRVRSVGVSLLGGNTGVEGGFELGVDSIRAVNEEDVGTAPDVTEERTPVEEPKWEPAPAPVVGTKIA